MALSRFDAYVPGGTSGTPDGYAGKKTPYLDTIRYVARPEANVRLAALQANDVDVAADILPSMAQRLEGNANVSLMEIFPSACRCSC